MGRLKIGVVVDGRRIGFREGIEKASEMRLAGVQLYCTHGELHPDNLGASGRRDLRRLLGSKGLALSALCADFGKSFKNPDVNNELVPLTVKCLELARELGTDVVTSHFGAIPEDPADPARRAMEGAARDIASRAEGLDVSFASETGAESPEALKDFLEAMASPALKVNYDPANLTRRGFSAVEGVGVLGPWIVHTHVKDGRKGGGELPVGEGDVPWEEYLGSLAAVDYDGFFTIEREGGEDFLGDVARAADFLRRF